jgi:sn-glycerol 3-phosphate transport system permease protein
MATDLTLPIDGADDPDELGARAADGAATVDLGGRPERSRGFDEPTGLRRVGRYGLLAAVVAIVVFPIYTTLIAALKPGDKVFDNPLVPDAFTLDVIRAAWTAGNLDRYLINSLIVATIVTVCQLVTSVLAAYAFAILRFPGRTLIFFLFTATLLVPAEAIMVVNRDTVDSLGWLNTFQGLSVPFLATAFGIFLLRQVFLTLPRDLLDAAAIDGVGHFGFMRHVAVPLVRPTLGALALFSFLGTWNQYLWPNLVITEQDMNTVQSGLRILQASIANEPNLVMAGTVIAALPIFIALLVFQRQLVRGLTAGAVKG